MSTRRNAWGARACWFSERGAVYPSVYPFFSADSLAGTIVSNSQPFILKKK